MLGTLLVTSQGGLGSCWGGAGAVSNQLRGCARADPHVPPSFRAVCLQLPHAPGLCPSVPGQKEASSHQNSPAAGDSSNRGEKSGWEGGLWRQGWMLERYQGWQCFYQHLLIWFLQGEATTC